MFSYAKIELGRDRLIKDRALIMGDCFLLCYDPHGIPSQKVSVCEDVSRTIIYFDYKHFYLKGDHSLGCGS